MRCEGPTLFAEGDLADALADRLSADVCNAICTMLIEYGMLTRLALKRAVIASLPPSWSRLSLGTPARAAATRRTRTGYDPVEMTCSVPFRGNPELFRYAGPVWPPARRLRGRVSGSKLVLAAEGYGGEEPWLPAIIASELAEIERVTAAQALVLRRFDQIRETDVRALIDRAYPRIDLTELEAVYSRTMALAGPDDLYWNVSVQVWGEDKAALGEKWFAD